MTKKVTDFKVNVNNGYVGGFTGLMRLLQQQPFDPDFKKGLEVHYVHDTPAR